MGVANRYNHQRQCASVAPAGSDPLFRLAATVQEYARQFPVDFLTAHPSKEVKLPTLRGSDHLSPVPIKNQKTILVMGQIRSVIVPSRSEMNLMSLPGLMAVKPE